MENKKKIMYWALVIIWMGIIFYLSHQPATESNDLSRGITEKIINLIGILTKDLEIDIRSFNHMIRKMSHFSAYFILGVLVLNAIMESNQLNTKWIMVSIIICVLYAISDEFHQCFIPGRGAAVLDVLIDSVGATTGILLNKFLITIKSKIPY